MLRNMVSFPISIRDDLDVFIHSFFLQATISQETLVPGQRT